MGHLQSGPAFERKSLRSPTIPQTQPSTWENFTTPQLADITLYLIAKVEAELDEDDDREILMAVASELSRRRSAEEER
jgi:hypothetical protein